MDKTYKLEKDLRKANAKYLKGRPDVFAFKIHGSGWGVSGISDVIGVQEVFVKDLVMAGVKTVGVFIAIEEKAEKGKPSDKQLSFLKKVTDLGGKGAVVKSIEEVKELLEW